MSFYTMSSCTVNGRFHSNSHFHQSGLWYVIKKELQKLFPYSQKCSNFVKFKFNNGVIAMIYTKGGFKLVITKNHFERVIHSLHSVINFIRVNYASQLFCNELVSASFRVTQVFFTIQVDFDTNNTTKLSFEKVIV